MLLKPQKTKKSKRVIIVGLLIAGVILAASAAIWWWQKQKTIKDTPTAVAPVNTVNYEPPKERERNDPSLPITSSEGESKAPQTEQPKPSAVSITISRADQASAGQDLNIRTIVSGTKQGTCMATLTKAGQTTVTKTNSLKYEVASGYCNFDIPVANFSVGDTWELTVTIHANEGDDSEVKSVSIIK